MHTNKTKKQNKHDKYENTQWNVHNIVDQSKNFDAFIRFKVCLLHFVDKQFECTSSYTRWYKYQQPQLL